MAIVKGGSEFYWWAVKHKVPVDNGKYLPVGFEAKFKRLSKDRVNEIMRKLDADDSDLVDSDLVSEVLHGWRNVREMQVEDGAAPDFNNDEQREWVLGIIGMEAAIIRAWMSSITEGKVKN